MTHHTTLTSELLDRAPPADIEAEKMVLGSILVSVNRDETFATVSDRLQPRDFHDDANRTIYETMKRMRQNNMPIDVKLLCESLKSATANDVCAFEQVGGPNFIVSLAKSVPIAAHARYYASIVRERADKRRLFDFAIQTAQASHNGAPAADIVSTLRETLDDFERRDTSIRFRRFTAAELDDAEIDLDYLIDGVLVANHVGGIIGASKTLKTTIAADLAFSVATGGHFLGYYPVLRPVRTAFMSGESGLPTIQETFRRVARAAGREFRDASNLIVSDQLPQLGSVESMTALRRFIELDEIELLIIDPLYLCAETEGREGSLFAMGALLKSVAEVAQDCGTTLKILHHMTQGSAKTSGDRNPELFDSAWAGTQQFFRQWIAINRRSAYAPERPGRHELRLVTGGSMGHATGVALDIEEGQRTDPGGRRWDVAIRSLKETSIERQTAGDSQKEQIRELKFQGDCELVRLKLDNIYPEGTTRRQLRALCRISADRIDAALAALDEFGETEICDVKISNHKQPGKGIRLKKETKIDELFSPE